VRYTDEVNKCYNLVLFLAVILPFRRVVVAVGGAQVPAPKGGQRGNLLKLHRDGDRPL
jgi:hypothetical protein